MNNTRTLALLVALVSTTLALLASLPGIGYIDSGEMATAAATLGIPHPTGYPLLMILGKVAVTLWPGDPIDGLNLLNALFLGAASGFLVPLFVRFLRPNIEKTDGEPAPRYAAAASALLLSVTTIWWSVGTGFEAYALAALLMVLVLWSFLRFTDAIVEGQGRALSQGYLFAFLLGLSFTNHMMTVVLAPALLLHYGLTAGVSMPSIMRLVRIVPLFLLGLLPYIYLPLRAAADPVMNWGHPDTFARFFAHVTGGQYQGVMFDFSVLGDQLGWFATTLLADFLWVGLLLPIVGAFALRKESRRLLLARVILVSTFLFAGTYAIREIEPYFLPAMIALGMMTAGGFLFLARRFGTMAPVAVGLLLAIAGSILHFGAVDRSDDDLPRIFATEFLDGLPPDAFVLTTRWDWLISTTMYAQHVEGIRPDVTIANLNMLHDNVYLASVVGRIPRLGRAKEQIENFRLVRLAYDAGQSGADVAYPQAFTRLVNGLIAAHGGPVVVTPEVDPAIGAGLSRVPYNLAYVLRKDLAYLPQEFTDESRFQAADGPGLVDRMSVGLYYGEMAKLRGIYEAKRGDSVAAKKYRARIFASRPAIEIDDIPSLPLGNAGYVETIIRWFDAEYDIQP